MRNQPINQRIEQVRIHGKLSLFAMFAWRKYELSGQKKIQGNR